MSLSIDIARILGPILLISGLAIFVNKQGFVKIAQDFMNSPALIFMAGLMALIPGVAIVAHHNIWAGWPVVITIFGWACVLAGVLRLFLGEKLIPWGRAMMEKSWLLPVSALLYVVLGLYLTMKGFGLGI